MSEQFDTSSKKGRGMARKSLPLIEAMAAIRVDEEIKALIEPEAWERCETLSRAQRDSLHEVLSAWTSTNAAD
jgi:hypothetical protein